MEYLRLRQSDHSFDVAKGVFSTLTKKSTTLEIRVNPSSRIREARVALVANRGISGNGYLFNKIVSTK
ncbi:hypothetical protein SeLEV6574_g07029 [Synchytrium endobioticum]|uniref:Uncharacterized protein n=1 Tax=Synchytrium endobioticum TaxID=286115 RepID=A0A507CLX0_9FUNG|nr:hypothetical protein SeLEV6574_g07029 [Synchytrium endobioticum]